MASSPYLVQALQALSAPQSAPQAASPDLAGMQKAVGQRKAWEAANPGQSYMAHGFGQLAQNLRGAPQAVMAAPGNALKGLQGLGASVLR
jgi:hypothetical protein